MDNGDVYEDRLAQLLHAFANADHLTNATRDVVLDVLHSIESIHQLWPEMLAGDEYASAFWRSAEPVLAMFPEALRRGDIAVLDWASSLVFDLSEALGRRVSVRNLSDDLLERTREQMRLADRSLQRIAMLQTDLRLTESGRVLDEIEDVADAARTAAGTIAGGNLSQYFGEYAKTEKRTADLFRVLTVLLIGAGITVSLFIPHGAVGDWVALAYRLLIVGGIAGLAAYIGRQAGQHRRTANWAKALQVQLLAFAAFIAPIQDEESKNAIYGAFAARVFGAPPERPTAKDGSDLGAAQVVDLMTAFVKKS